MSKDKLASLVLALRRVSPRMRGLVLDIVIRFCGEERELFYHSLKRFVAEWRSPIAELPEMPKAPKVIAITRTFNSEKFFGKGWSIVEKETDPRSKSLTELDPTKVEFVTTLKDGETRVWGEEKLRRLKAGNYTRLDADIFHTLWENQSLIPESWKEKVNGDVRFIYFDGTVLRDPDGRRYVLCLYWSGGAWRWNVGWLDRGWFANNPSVVLAS